MYQEVGRATLGCSIIKIHQTIPEGNVSQKALALLFVPSSSSDFFGTIEYTCTQTLEHALVEKLT